MLMQIMLMMKNTQSPASLDDEYAPAQQRAEKNSSLNTNISSPKWSIVFISFHRLCLSSIKEMCYVMTEQSEEVGQEYLDWICPPKIPFWAIINFFVL